MNQKNIKNIIRQEELYIRIKVPFISRVILNHRGKVD